ncbi:hypothetical protein C7U92_17600 [Bradyrhizobium sp. WBOS7]|uniref:Uncharacterized protein n=1 Tax=Bradyrhizobium betae TaxID=244734 RepID=A0AAE9NAJ5_9BRAD|nr:MULTISPECIES: hypothetical protein [Bradyrhizobium]MDD1570774.1 hypothetical protein [Bradyrhizobium sp. WBOS1]UUO34783.1 hypothetical protein DCK84_09545 [Bradyrhizobium sp. WBOS01]MDD1527620.1 hypothetical protein [Bradyrhizobium sp. WBOS2]MDD1578532.1 hypothetical protein [Bradyrhizobium sp. WBOS7]MDD1601255.1 hypothetical protein [Bradyrhizobium sp. WBOS16]
MPALLRPVLAALGVACLLSATSLASSGTAFAQAKQPPAPSQAAPAQQQAPALKQIALTDKQVDGVLAAQKDMDAVTAKLPENTAPDQKVMAQLDEVAKKHGFAGLDDYSTVVDNISLVIGGFDPASKKYVGTNAVIKAQIAQVRADKKMPAKDKKEALDELTQALKTPAPQVENKGNIDLIARYYDKLIAALGDDQN